MLAAHCTGIQSNPENNKYAYPLPLYTVHDSTRNVQGCSQGVSDKTMPFLFNFSHCLIRNAIFSAFLFDIINVLRFRSYFLVKLYKFELKCFAEVPTSDTHYTKTDTQTQKNGTLQPIK